jgi:hypothetical protein
MAFNWKDIIQQQLAGLPMANMSTGGGMQALSAMQPNQQLRTGNNPNPKFPNARDKWEGFKQWFGGTPESVEQYSTANPQQQSVMQLLQMLGLHGLQDPTAGFEPIEQQARNQFSQQTVPSLAERFTSMGAGNALSSGTFASQLGGAGAGLEGDLASQKAQYGQQNMQQILQMLQLGLGGKNENIHRPRQEGFGEKAAMVALQAAIKALTAGAL